MGAQEVDLSNVLARKRGVADMEAQRNGISCSSLGDKYYKHPEYSERFFHPGGCAVGSTFVRGSMPKTVARNSTAWKAFAAENPDAVKHKTYVELQKEKRERDSQFEVRSLTGCDTTRKKNQDADYLTWV